MNSVTYSYHQISVSPLLHWDRMLASSNLSWIETHERLTWTKLLQRPQRSTTTTTSFSQCSFTRISWCLLCLRKKPQLFPFNHCTIQIRTQNGPVTLPVVERWTEINIKIVVDPSKLDSLNLEQEDFMTSTTRTFVLNMVNTVQMVMRLCSLSENTDKLNFVQQMLAVDIFGRRHSSFFLRSFALPVWIDRWAIIERLSTRTNPNCAATGTVR